MYTCECLYTCAYVASCMPGGYRGQKGATDPLELELPIGRCEPHDGVVRTDPGSSARTAMLVTSAASSQSVHHFFTEVYTERLEKGNLPGDVKDARIV